MPGIFPVLLNSTAGALQCIHGGVFKGIGSTTTTIDGEAPAITKEGLLTIVTTCQPPPPAVAAGVLPCVFSVPAQTMATRVTMDSTSFRPVTLMMPQIASSNAMPSFVGKTKSTTSVVL
jgi:hypothetical protein